MKMEQSVPKRRHIKFRRRGITQKKTYNIQNMAKVWNQEFLWDVTQVASIFLLIVLFIKFIVTLMCEVCGSVLFSHALSCFDYITWWWMTEVWIWNIRGLIMTGKNASILKNPGSIMLYLPQIRGSIMTGKNASILKKSWLNNALFTTNHKWTDRGSNPNLRGERPATNRLICLTALLCFYMRKCDYINMVTTSGTDTVLTNNLVSCCNFMRRLLSTSLRGSRNYFF